MPWDRWREKGDPLRLPQDAHGEARPVQSAGTLCRGQNQRNLYRGIGDLLGLSHQQWVVSWHLMEFNHQNRHCCGFARLKLVLCPIFEICPDWVVFPNRNDLKGHRQMNHEGSISSEQSRNYPEGCQRPRTPAPSNKKTLAAFVDLGIKGNDSKPAHAWRL